MPEDSILAELRQVREQLAAEHGHDLEAIYRHIKELEREREQEGKVKFVSFPPRDPKGTAQDAA